MSGISTGQKIIAGVAALIVAIVLWQGWRWTVDRVYVHEGESIMLRYKGPLVFRIGLKNAAPGQFAQVTESGKPLEVGIIEQMRGPGRHFFCPIWWEITRVPDWVVPSGSVAVVTSKMGEELPVGQFLVDGDFDEVKYKGVLRKVFGPGRYRANPYRFIFKIVQIEKKQVDGDEKIAGWVNIPTGFVGVVTHLTDDLAKGIKKGIQDQVLQPGLYAVNPNEAQIDVVEIGYRESIIECQMQSDAAGKMVLDESGEPTPVHETGINFPSDDGFEIQLDFTAIWGIMPENAADIIRNFGNITQAEKKVVLPQAESICRTNGSKLKAKALLVGESRQTFQDETTKQYHEVLLEKKIELLYGLIRQIYIPQEIRLPIQESYIADENKLTRDQEKLTATVEAELREAEKQVDLASKTTEAQTTKLVAEKLADGEKQAKEFGAEGEKLVATIDRQAAELDAQRVTLLGEAEGKSKQLQNEASAGLFGLAVKSFGTPGAYTKYQFAHGLPEDAQLNFMYAGPGTLWTDSSKLGIFTTPPAAPTPVKAEADKK
jgi:hypothetical protein